MQIRKVSAEGQCSLGPLRHYKIINTGNFNDVPLQLYGEIHILISVL